MPAEDESDFVPEVKTAINELVIDLFNRAATGETLEEALAACSEAGYQFRMFAGQFNTPASLAQAALMVGFFSGVAHHAARRGGPL